MQYTGVRVATMPFRILCLDSGSTRGLFGIRVLRLLDRAYPGFLASVDMVAGTSAGGICALEVAAGADLLPMEDMFINHSSDMFHEGFIGRLDNAMNRLPTAPYGSETRMHVFQKEISRFGGYQYICQLPKKVCICTTRLKPKPSLGDDGNQCGIELLHNLDGSCEEKTKITLLDAAMRTTAAATYFPLWQGYADGGLICGNPSTIAVTLAVEKLHLPLSEIRVLSIGTGKMRAAIPETDKQQLDWGTYSWLKNDLIVHLMLEGNKSLSHQMTKQLLGETGYRRIDFTLSHSVAVDDYSPELLNTLIREAHDAAQDIIEGNHDGTGTWISQNFGISDTSKSLATLRRFARG